MSRFDEAGRVKHDGWMRPSRKYPNLFVVGDVLSCGDAMTVVAVSRQVPWLVKAIKQIIKGGSVDKLKAYQPWPKPPILIPLGPKLGASVLPLGANGKVFGAFLTSLMKGKDLFIKKYRKLLTNT